MSRRLHVLAALSLMLTTLGQKVEWRTLAVDSRSTCTEDSGNRIEQIEGATEASCKAGCTLNSLCHAVFFSTYQERGAWGMCKLYASCDPTTLQTALNPGSTYVRLSAQDVTIFATNQRCVQTVLQRWPGPEGKTHEECRDECAANEKCNFFAHRPTALNDCRIYDSCERRASASNSTIFEFHRPQAPKPPVPSPVPLATISALQAIAIAMIVLGSLSIAALTALLVVKCRKKRSEDTEDGLLTTLARRVTGAKANRAVNRWGLGCDLPAAGERNFFRAGFVPTFSVLEAISSFGVFDNQQMKDMADFAEQKTQEMAERGTPMFRDHAQLITSFTEESELYVTLLKACRTIGKESEHTLDHYRGYLYHLERAVGNLSPYIGRTFRSIDVEVRAASYQVGSTITWQAPSSSSKVEGMVVNFMRVVEEEKERGPRQYNIYSIDVEGAIATQPLASSSFCSILSSFDVEGSASKARKNLSGTIFIIESISGKDISMFSAFPEEEEVLFTLNSHFRVMACLEGDQEKREMLPSLSGFDLSRVVVLILAQI